MRRTSLLACAALAMIGPVPGRAETVPSSAACSSEAVKQAGKLLAFHLGGEEPGLHVDEAAKPLPSIANPANRKQRFDVLEVMGYFYKGEYRMRFEYYRIGGDCVLMGQEILEIARL